MSMMLVVGLAGFALVDREQVASSGERQRETSFNLTEQLLDAQVYKLSRHGPAPAASTTPTPTAPPASSTAAAPTPPASSSASAAPTC